MSDELTSVVPQNISTFHCTLFLLDLVVLELDTDIAVEIDAARAL